MQEEAIRVEIHQIKEGTPFYNWAMEAGSKHWQEKQPKLCEYSSQPAHLYDGI